MAIEVEIPRRQFTVEEYHRMADAGIFQPGERVELIEGKDLRSAMTQAQARRLRLPTTVASYIISEVAAGLDYAHRKSDGFGRALGIVHCDVSPSNVMLSTDGYVKILDAVRLAAGGRER